MTSVTAFEASSIFTFDAKENDPTDFPGGKLIHARWTKVLTGEIRGTGVVHLLMFQQSGGPAAYVGIEHYDVEVKGRRGTFLLLHVATMSGSKHETSWTIVAGSGTGGLTGIAGTAEITLDHQLILRYTLPDKAATNQAS